METTNPSLICGMKYRSETAWTRFQEQYQPLIRTACKNSGVRLSREDIEDFTQNVLLKIHQSISRFERRGRGSFRCWIRAITYHEIMQSCRDRGREVVAPAVGGTDAREQIELRPDSDAINVEAIAESIADTLGRESSMPDLVFRQEAMQLIAGRLKDPGRLEAFLLLKAYDQKPKDVSTETGMEPAHVSVAASQLFKKLKDFLEGRLKNHLELNPDDALEQHKDKLTQAAWEYLSEQMGQLLEDLWELVEKRKELSDVEQATGLRFGVVGQAKLCLQTGVSEVAGQLKQEDEGAASPDQSCSS